jgi:methylmalonyl-CoA/ethylmalonyl-CoA epimerase
MDTMKFHHLGVACEDLKEMLRFIRSTHDLVYESDIVFDVNQGASLCLIKTAQGVTIELVSGDVVQSLVSRGTTYYHCCYEVPCLDSAIEKLRKEKCKVISKPVPAVLFDYRKVCFLMTPMGLIELLDGELPRKP